MRHHRIRKIGEPYMPLPQDYARGVFFVGRHGVGPEGQERIDGTSFLVVMEGETDGFRLFHAYAITAAHVVDGALSSFVRVPMLDGPPVDLDVPEWITHGKHDVAVAPIHPPENHGAIATGLDQFIDDPTIDQKEWSELELGDAVYFIGLLGKVPEMVKRNVPIVRAGTLGAVWQERVPVKRSPVDETKYITAHLIDCRSFGGFSGSPCYIQRDRAAVINTEEGPGITSMYWTLLLGLIGGHFDDWARTRSRENIGADEDEHEYAISDDIMAPVSTGVGYVIPAEFIRETLMKEELVVMRKQDEAKAAARAKRKEDENAATMDSTENESEFDRFKEATRQLVNTPKPKPEGSDS